MKFMSLILLMAVTMPTYAETIAVNDGVGGDSGYVIFPKLKPMYRGDEESVTKMQLQPRLKNMRGCYWDKGEKDETKRVATTQEIARRLNLGNNAGGSYAVEQAMSEEVAKEFKKNFPTDVTVGTGSLWVAPSDRSERMLNMLNGQGTLWNWKLIPPPPGTKQFLHTSDTGSGVVQTPTGEIVSVSCVRLDASAGQMMQDCLPNKMSMFKRENKMGTFGKEELRQKMSKFFGQITRGPVACYFLQAGV